MAPSIVLVPGFCTIGTPVYAPLKAELQALGYSEVITINLASVDALGFLPELLPNPLEADIAHIQVTVKSLVDSGKDVVVAAHSYGGTPTLYACEGLWKHERQAKGLKGGVLKAVLLSSSLTPPGESVAGMRAKFGAENGKNLDGNPADMHIETIHGMPVLFPDGFETAFFSDFPENEQKQWAEKALRPTPLGTLYSNAPAGTVSDWRIAFLITAELDPSMTAPFQKFLIENGKNAGAVIEEVREIKSGHFVQISHAKEIAEWIKEVVD